MSEGNGWQEVPLGELCQLVNGKAFKPSDWSDNGLPIIRIQNLNDATKPFNCWAGSLHRQVMVNAGNVLLGWSGTPGTSFGAHIWERQQGVLNQHIFRVDLDETRIAKEWAVPAINQQLEVLIGKAHGGVGLRHVKKSEVEALRIPLPPLAEQKRIAGILKEQLAAVQRARAAAEAQLEAAKALPAAYLRDVFGSDESATWPHTSLKEIANIRGGVQKTPNRRPVEFHRPYLTVRNVQRGYLDLSQLEHFELTPDELETLRLCEGDLLIVEGNGSRNHIGRNAIFDGCIEECVHQNHIIRVRLDPTKASPRFVSRFLNSSAGMAQMVEKAQTTSGLFTLSAQKVGSLTVPLPPVDVQNEVVRSIADELSVGEQLVSALTDQLKTVNALPAALLRAAFQGKL